jgi:hypothetical protein
MHAHSLTHTYYKGTISSTLSIRKHGGSSHVVLVYPVAPTRPGHDKAEREQADSVPKPEWKLHAAPSTVDSGDHRANHDSRHRTRLNTLWFALTEHPCL